MPADVEGSTIRCSCQRIYEFEEITLDVVFGIRIIEDTRAPAPEAKRTRTCCRRGTTYELEEIRSNHYRNVRSDSHRPGTPEGSSQVN